MERVLPEIIGVAGTLLGTVLGWLLGKWSQQGKLYCYSEWKDSFYHSDDYGGTLDSKSREESEGYMYRLTIELHNRSGEPRIMRHLEVAFYNDKKIIFRDTPSDESTGHNSGSLRFYDKVQSITIPAKTVYTMNLRGGFNYSDKRFSQIWESNAIMLLYRDDHDSEEKFLIKKEDFSQFFENHPEPDEN